MPDREKVITWLELCLKTIDEPDCRKECPYYEACQKYEGRVIFQPLMRDTLALLKEQEPKPPIHVHQEYPEHDWETYENGEVDDFAWWHEYCNGPMCKRCYYSFCIHCEPNGWHKEPCIVDFFKCPNCGEKINKNTKFCDNCGQAVKWNELEKYK